MMKRFLALLLSLALCVGSSGVLWAVTGCNYPTTLDTFAAKSTGDYLTVANVNIMFCAIEKLESGPLQPNLGTVGAPAYSFTADGDTGLYSSAANVVDVAAGGIRVASFGTVASGVNYIQLLPSATAGDVKISALGTDTDISLDLITKGTGVVKANGTAITTAESGTWTDVTGSRAIDTVYQNTGGKKRRVGVTISVPAAASAFVQVGSANPPTLNVGRVTNGAGGVTQTIGQYVEVPSNWYYRVLTDSGTPAIGLWHELDE